MDLGACLEHLKRFSQLDDSLNSILKKIYDLLNDLEFDSSTLSIYLEQGIQILIPLCCEQNHRAARNPAARQKRIIIDTERMTDRSSTEKILDNILIVLLKISYKSELAMVLILETLVKHMEAHLDCMGNLYIFLKLLNSSEQARAVGKDMDLVSIILGQVETKLLQPESPVQSAAVPQVHDRKQSEMLPLSSSPVPPELSRIISKSIMMENESFIGELPMLHGYTVSSRELRRNAAKRKMEDSRPRSPVVPILAIPQESTRSNKKWDMQKSVSYRSGRVSALSGSWGDNLFSPMSPYSKETTKPSPALFDFDSSFVAEEGTNYCEVLPASRVMKDFALQLGEACLTADLTALIAQKREGDIEKKAKQTAFPGPNLVKPGKSKAKGKSVKKNARSSSLNNLNSQLDVSSEFIYGEESDKDSKVIVLLLNIVFKFYEQYEPYELQFVRNPGNLLFGHLLSAKFHKSLCFITLKNQEKFECSDDEQEIYEEEICCRGENLDDGGNREMENLIFKKEEALAVPTGTVAGVSPRGVGFGYSGRESKCSWDLDQEVSELGLAFYKVKNTKLEDFIIPAHVAIFKILQLFSQYTEAIHRQAVTPVFTPCLPSSSSSQLYEMMSPKKGKMRSPNISISLINEELKEGAMWVNGTYYRELIGKERIRKKTDIFLLRLSKRLIWVQETYSGQQLLVMEANLMEILSRYLRLGRSRVSFFQAVDLIFESLINTKKRIMESIEVQGGSEAEVRQLAASFIGVITQLLRQCQTPEAYKLIHDVFVGNNPWTDVIKVFSHKVLGDTVRNEARALLKYLNSVTVFCRKVVAEMNLDSKNSELSSYEKTWKENIRRILSTLNWLVVPVSGLIPRFLHKCSPETKPMDIKSTSPPRNIHIIRAALELLINFYWFSSRFHVMRSEKYALFFIRMHYISFLKLYTFNKPKKSNERVSLNATGGLSASLSSTIDNSNPSVYSQACLILCKMHLKCLFAYARNRTPDVTRKFFQFRIIEFLTREIDLEFDIKNSIELFKKVHMAEKKRVVRKLTGKIDPEDAQNFMESREKGKSVEGEPKKIGFSLNLAGVKKDKDGHQGNQGSMGPIGALGLMGPMGGHQVNDSVVMGSNVEAEAKVMKPNFSLNLLGVRKDSDHSKQVSESKDLLGKAGPGIEDIKPKNLFKSSEEPEKMEKNEDKAGRGIMIEPEIPAKPAFSLNLLGIRKDALSANVKVEALPFDQEKPLIQKENLEEAKELLTADVEVQLKKPGVPLLKLGEKTHSKLQKSDVPPLQFSGHKVDDLSSPPMKKPAIPALKIGVLNQDPDKKQIDKIQFEKTLIQEDSKAFELTRIQENLDKQRKTQLFAEDEKVITEKMLENQDNVQEKEFYEEQRKCREIYCDEELQVYILGLIFCLLLTPTRGTLDELYCSQFPINNGKPNVLFILHYHLNHDRNKMILPKLQKLVGCITPPLSGLRLLKLLSTTFFDSSMYTGWKKIAVGAYGTVYECSTGLAEPQKVAIKKMSVPKSIYDRCVLHDIFTEIASLEEFRLERCVTDLYDYGLDENDYYIVMKKYPLSLKDWREKIKGSLEEVLPRCLTIYKEVLKSMQIIHNHNVTHYDIKCDNVLLDDPIEDCQVTIGDFGESRMFVNSEDEVCLRNKGTEYIKSPEMLLITVAAKKEHDKYDRRRKIGTTRASDIWSLGCLLYELLTCEFLFLEADWVHFYIRCTSPNEELLTEDRMEKLHQNTYLIDFLKYMLVRDPRHRPPIDKVLKRFEHLHALLVNSPPAPYRTPSSYHIGNLNEFGEVVQECQKLMTTSSTRIRKSKSSPSLLRITHDVYMCSHAYLKENFDWITSIGITHMVYSEADESTLKRFQNIMIGHFPLQSLAGVMDFLRSAHMTRGKVVFVENNTSNIRECLLLCLSDIFLTSFYETWSLVNSQTLFFYLPTESLREYSRYTQLQFKIKQYLALFPKYQCLCGSCTIILHRKKADPKNQVIRQCSCAKQYRNVDTSDCPSPGCGDFLNTIKDMHSINWPYLQWGFASREDLLYVLNSQSKNEEQILLSSLNNDSNSELVKWIEKRPWRSGADQWALFKCKVCHMWIYSLSNDGDKIAYLMNINTTGIQKGIMSAGGKLSVPVLNKIQLPLVMVQKGNEMVKPQITVNSFAPTNKVNSGRLLT